MRVADLMSQPTAAGPSARGRLPSLSGVPGQPLPSNLAPLRHSGQVRHLHGPLRRLGTCMDAWVWMKYRFRLRHSGQVRRL